MNLRRCLAVLSLLAALSFNGGCAALFARATSGLADGLSEAILDNRDLAMVRDGAPSFLILIDGLIANSPDDPQLLRQGAQLTSAYAAAFVDEPERASRLQSKALEYAQRAVCESLRKGCALRQRPFEAYEAWLAERKVGDVPVLYQLGSSWAAWIQAHSDDFAAIAELQRVKALMSRIIELDPDYDYGGAHLYMGVFETLLPPALGGRPEQGRQHFERALELSQGRYLLTKVLYADQYARLVFDQELHDRLLREVLDADPAVPGLTLINVVAQRDAAALLESSDDYFL